MIVVKNVDTWGFEHAVRGMRNPMNSWDKSDSGWGLWTNDLDSFDIGQNDLALMKRLYKAGTEHRKYLRQIFVSMDITAPLYWWKEFDTYKIGTVSNSCSTMHKIHAKEFELDDFSWDHLLVTDCPLFFQEWDGGKYKRQIQPQQLLTDFIIPSLNVCREKYLETKNKKYWWQMIQLLPSSYNQRRTITMNYENVMNIINQRFDHKLDEWVEFVFILKCLPYVDDIR